MPAKAVLRSKRSLGSVRHASGALTSSLIRLHPCRVACPTLHATAEIVPENPDNGEQQHHYKPSMVHTRSHVDPNGWPNARVPPPVPHEQQQQRVNQPQQLHQWVVFKQCTMLAAAALAAAPLILVLDIAENACLAICQAKHYMRLTQQAAAKPCRHGSRTPASAPPGSQQQQQQQQCQQRPRAAASSPASTATFSSMTIPQLAHGGTGMEHAYANTDVHSTTASFSTTKSTGHSAGVNRQIRVSSSDARPPVLDLLPPWTPMALAMLPVAALVLRHFGDVAVLWQLCLAAASLLVQGYVNMLLVVMQRGSKPTTTQTEWSAMQTAAAAAVARSSDGSFVEGTCPQQKQQHIRALHGTTVLRTSSSSSNSIAFELQQSEESSHGWWQESNSCTYGTDSSNSNSSSRTSTVAVVTSALFRMVQVLGDGFRVWCLASACWLIVQQQAPAIASAWSACTVMAQQVLSSSSTGAGLPQVTGAAAAAALKLQQLFAGGFGLGVDVGLCIAAISMYALALAARVLPSVNDVV